MATTTNYSWTTPDDTALVKDGAAAIRSLGTAIDTTTKNLNPGTTAGDVDYYTSTTAKARLGIGTAGQVLTVNSGATAPQWSTLSSEKSRIILKNTGEYLRRRTTTSFDNFDAITSRLYLTPMYLSGNSFDRISMRTASGTYSGTGVYRLGIYNVDLTTGRPTTVYLDAGTVNGTTNNTNLEITISTTPPAGYYYLAMVEQTAPSGGGNVAAITLTDANDGIALGTYPAIDSAAASYNTFYYQAGVTGALPTISSLTIATGQIPMVLLRMA
jgi:hypothetical protein